MKRILIPTDFSDNSWNAIRYAIEFYKDDACEFDILHLYEVPTTQLLTVSSKRVGYFYENAKIQSKQGLEMVLERIENSSVGIDHTFKTISESGSLVTLLKRLVEDYQYDLIIMGTKGASGVKEIFLGSNTQRVIRSVDNCPILVIPEDCRCQKISNVGFPTNFERIYYKSEISPIISLAKVHKAMIRMLHMHDEPKLTEIQNYNSTNLEIYFKTISCDFHVTSDFSNIEKAIQSFIKDLNIDFLIMINYKHGFLDRLTREGIIKKMTFHTSIPFLVIPADN